MAELFHDDSVKQRVVWDRNPVTGYRYEEENLAALADSRTLYVGNLSFYTSEAQITETFSMVGPVQRVIMGINRLNKTPCGFCFVEFYNQDHACAALKYVSETACDGRIIRCGWDSGFKEGRQYGRGKKTGGQVREEMVETADPDRPMPQQRPHYQQNNYRGGGGGGGRGRGGHGSYDRKPHYNNRQGGGGYQYNDRRGQHGGGKGGNYHRDNRGGYRDNNNDRSSLGKRGRDDHNDSHQDSYRYSGGGGGGGGHDFDRGDQNRERRDSTDGQYGNH